MRDPAKNDAFEVRIDFRPGEGDPARVFKAMSGILDSLQSLDSHLLSSFDVSLTTSLVLDEIEAGSIKAKLRNVVEGVPDEALKDGDWKKVLGHFLVRAKWVVIKWLGGRSKIKSRDDVRVLEGELLELAEETNVKQLPAYAAPKAEQLLTDIHLIQESLGSLAEGDEASYFHGDESISINRHLEISNEVVREVLTKEVVKSSAKRIVKVKKPDYLGQSMWGLQYDGRSIDAKITDLEWLIQFQGRRIDVRPGDSLRVMLYEEISYGYEGEIVHRHYEVERVYEVIKPPSQPPMRF